MTVWWLFLEKKRSKKRFYLVYLPKRHNQHLFLTIAVPNDGSNQKFSPCLKHQIGKTTVVEWNEDINV